MSAVAGSTWELDISLPQWLEVPAGDVGTGVGTRVDTGVDIEQWRADVAAVFTLLEEVDSQLGDDAPQNGLALDIPRAIDGLLEFSATLPDGHHIVAGLALPGRWPLPVVIAVTPTDESYDLLAAAGARGGSPIEAPTVDYLPEELGDGVRVTRLDLDDDGAVWATVGCARRAAGLDTVLTWRTTELDLVPSFSPYLESLVGSVRVGSAE